MEGVKLTFVMDAMDGEAIAATIAAREADIRELVRVALEGAKLMQDYAARIAQLEVERDELTRIIKDLREQVAALESREVCTRPHENVEVCGFCQRDEANARIAQLDEALDHYVTADIATDPIDKLQWLVQARRLTAIARWSHD